MLNYLHVNILIKIVNMGNQHVFVTFYKIEKNNFKKIKLKQKYVKTC